MCSNLLEIPHKRSKIRQPNGARAQKHKATCTCSEISCFSEGDRSHWKPNSALSAHIAHAFDPRVGRAVTPRVSGSVCCCHYWRIISGKRTTTTNLNVKSTCRIILLSSQLRRGSSRLLHRALILARFCSHRCTTTVSPSLMLKSQISQLRMLFPFLRSSLQPSHK